jgi:hypothetical protein
MAMSLGPALETGLAEVGASGVEEVGLRSSSIAFMR